VNKYLRTHILLEDDDFIFVNKKAGLLSIPDRFDAEKANLKTMLQNEYGEIFTVHRLDLNTSGIIVFAKNAEAHSDISTIWQENKVHKEYIAITANIPPSETGTIEAPIREHKTKKGTYVVSNLGKECRTDYKVLHSWENSYALLQMALHSGRTHQIRVHLAYIGCPLVVDPTYGYHSEFYLSSIKKKKVNIKKGMEERPLLSRTPLHASFLKFEIPGQDKYEVRSDYPKDIKAIKYQLDKRYGAKTNE
jgi:RluA family pseudouridine synthase